MRKAPPVLSLLLLVAPWAAHADGGPEQAVAAVQAPARAPLKKQLRARGAEVARLRQEVDRQEAQSREAGDRLEHQDQQIEALRRQLEQLERAQPAPQH